MTFRLPEHDPLQLMPADYIAHLFQRDTRTIGDWVVRYKLTRLRRDGTRARCTSKRYWLSYREVIERVPIEILDRKMTPRRKPTQQRQKQQP